jgi:integrase
LVKWFTNDTEAKAWAKEKSEDAGELGAAFGSVSEDERAALAAFRKFRTAHENPAPPPLKTVVTEFVKRWEASRAGAKVGVAVDEYLESLKKRGRSKAHLAASGSRLGRFKKDFGERVLPSFTPREIGDYILNLRGLVLKPEKGEPQGRKRKDGTPVKRSYRPVVVREDDDLSLESKAGYRRALMSFFEWARKRGMVTENPVKDAEKPQGTPKLPGVLTAAETKAFFTALLKHAPELVPFWAVRAFAGLRESEALRMDWHMIDLAAGKIILPKTITKSRHSREITIQPALSAFLATHVQPSGSVCSLSPVARRWRLRLALRSAPGLLPPRNWARHSYATYHLLAFRHPGETAMQLGHKDDPAMLDAHYRGVGTEKEALAFWDIRPETPANVVPMDAAGKVAEQPAERMAQ